MADQRNPPPPHEHNRLLTLPSPRSRRRGNRRVAVRGFKAPKMKTSKPAWTRRQFVSTVGSAATAAFVADAKAFSAVPKAKENRTGKRRIALIATEARKYSHAQHFIDRVLEGYGWQGRHHRPQLELAGLYM